MKATGYVTDAERDGVSAVFHLAVDAAPADILRGADGVPWWLAVRGADWRHPAGAALGRRRPAEPPGRPRVVARRPGLLPLGRQAPADRGRVGVRRPRRSRPGAPIRGATTSPTAGGGAATSGGRVPAAQHPRRRLPDHGAGDRVPAQRLRAAQRGRQRWRSGAATRSARPSTPTGPATILVVDPVAAEQLGPFGAVRGGRSPGAAGDAGRFVPAATATATATASPPAPPTPPSPPRATSASGAPTAGLIDRAVLRTQYAGFLSWADAARRPVLSTGAMTAQQVDARARAVDVTASGREADRPVRRALGLAGGADAGVRRPGGRPRAVAVETASVLLAELRRSAGHRRRWTCLFQQNRDRAAVPPPPAPGATSGQRPAGPTGVPRRRSPAGAGGGCRGRCSRRPSGASTSTSRSRCSSATTSPGDGDRVRPMGGCWDDLLLLTRYSELAANGAGSSAHEDERSRSGRVVRPAGRRRSSGSWRGSRSGRGRGSARVRLGGHHLVAIATDPARWRRPGHRRRAGSVASRRR